MGQNAKYSSRVDVFSFASELDIARRGRQFAFVPTPKSPYKNTKPGTLAGPLLCQRLAIGPTLRQRPLIAPRAPIV